MSQEHSRPPHYVGIGASAGGLEAIEAFFHHMAPDSGLAFIVVQHLSPDYKSMMVELLSKRTRMTVHRAQDGMAVESDHIYLIPPKQNLTIFKGRLRLEDQEPVRGINLPIDVFLRSLAEDQGERAVAIILSGTGSDGTNGVRAVKEVGGMVMVQDQHSAKFDGMPRAAISTGLADFILPPEEMPRQLLAYSRHPYVAGGEDTEPLTSDQDGLRRIFSAIKKRTKVDFTDYKPSTIIRRIERRMSVNQIHELQDYVTYLESYPGEVMALYREMLIGVTSFFRDEESYREMEETWLPELLARARDRTLRFWCAGASTGEEAYSLAILAQEAMEKTGRMHDLKIFATDIDRDAVMNAGDGRYPESIAADVPPEILGKYFYQKDGHFQIARHIREMVVFAQHNLLTDPPFTNIDLVSCRNLLIYLQPVLQQKVMRMFNFSLNPGGILFMGKSETVGDMADAFETVNLRHKIFRSTGKNRTRTREDAITALGRTDRARPARTFTHSPPARGEVEEERLLSRYLQVLGERYVPLSVVVNERLEVVHTLGDAEGFFTLPSGRVINDITKMATKELGIPLATGIQKAFRNGEELTYSNIRLRDLDPDRRIRLRLVPLPDKTGQEPLLAVFIEEMKPDPTPPAPPDTDTSFDMSEEAEARIADLEQELQFTKENLQATIEELETSNEELQATNEELLASNEELQATNEELQATNEELHTVNAEYQDKIIELRELNNDVDNLLTHSGIGKLLLDENLEIRRFSPAVAQAFRIAEADVGRPLGHLAHDFLDFDPEAEAKEVQDTDELTEKEARTSRGTWYLVRTVPYSIGPQVFAGVVMTFVDITELKKSQLQLQNSLRTSDDIIRHMPAGLFLYRESADGELLFESGNPEAVALTEKEPGELEGHPFDEIWPRARTSGLTEELEKVMETGTSYYTDEFSYTDDDVEGIFRISAFRLPGRRLAVSFEDVSETRRMEDELRVREKTYRNLFETMKPGVVFQDSEGQIILANPSAEEILGLTLDQMKGRTSSDPRWRAMREDGSDLPGDEHPSMMALKTGRPVHDFLMAVFNPVMEETRWLRVSAEPVLEEGQARASQVYTTFDDVTERVRAQRELRKAHERMALAYDQTGLAWWDWDVAAGRVEVSPWKARLIGLDPDEVPRKLDFWTSRIHPEDHDHAMNAMRDHLEGRTDEYRVTYRLRRDDGSYVALEDRGSVVEQGPGGEPRRVLGTVRPVEAPVEEHP